MQFFTRFVRSRRGNLATQAAIALGTALAMPEIRDAHAAGAPEVGVWINQEGKGAVEIKPCGAALCGNIVWLRNPVNDQGQPLFDRRNPDETKRNRSICGLPVIGNVKRTSEGWDEGWIYNPEEGAQFDVALQASGDKLTVTGYKGIKLFSKTLIWTRAPADLQRCDGAPQQTKAKPAVVPPKLAAPALKDGEPAVARKQPPPAAANMTAKPTAAPAPTAAKKPLAKDAKAGAAAPPGNQAKKSAATSPADALKVPPKKPAVATAKVPAQPGTAAATKKTAATAPATKAPVPTAAKPPAKKPAATATASTAGDKKAAVPSDKKPAAKPPVKKQSADEDDGSASAVE